MRIIKDLRKQFCDIRDQGNRPTCMAFAASDCHSFAKNNMDALSVEYAFYHAVQKTIDKNPQKGVSFEKISDAILTDGQPIENDWKYLNTLPPVSSWLPPSTLGTIYKHKSNKVSSHLKDIYTNLDNDTPVILVSDISYSFFTLSSTNILNAPPTETQRGIHATIAVGYAELDDGSRCLLIRNSWGKGWADSGYGWVHENYLNSRLYLIAMMD